MVAFGAIEPSSVQKQVFAFLAIRVGGEPRRSRATCILAEGCDGQKRGVCQFVVESVGEDMFSIVRRYRRLNQGYESATPVCDFFSRVLPHKPSVFELG